MNMWGIFRSWIQTNTRNEIESRNPLLSVQSVHGPWTRNCRVGNSFEYTQANDEKNEKAGDGVGNDVTMI